MGTQGSKEYTGAVISPQYLYTPLESHTASKRQPYTSKTLTHLAQVNQWRHLAKLSQSDFLFRKFAKRGGKKKQRWAPDIQKLYQD